MTSLADPFVNLIGYKAPNCVGTGDNGGLVDGLASDLVGPETIKLTRNEVCVNFDGFESYKVQFGEDCGGDLILTATVYTGKDCDVDSFVEDYSPTREDEDDCERLNRGGIDRLIVSASLNCVGGDDTFWKGLMIYILRMA